MSDLRHILLAAPVIIVVWLLLLTSSSYAEVRVWCLVSSESILISKDSLCDFRLSLSGFSSSCLPNSYSASTFDVFYKVHCLGLHMFYSTAGSIVRWVPKGITKNRPSENGICKQLASLGRFKQRVLYTAENFRCALYFGRYMFVKLQV